MGARHGRLAAVLATAWEAEVISARRMNALAEQVEDPCVRARLRVLSAFCRAHAARLLARLATLGQGPLPVPAAELSLSLDVEEELQREASIARRAAARYRASADLARAQADLSSAWICELNGTEEQERARELQALAQAQITPQLTGSPLPA